MNSNSETMKDSTPEEDYVDDMDYISNSLNELLMKYVDLYESIKKENTKL